jgi:hypothetical protein
LAGIMISMVFTYLQLQYLFLWSWCCQNWIHPGRLW